MNKEEIKILEENNIETYCISKNKNNINIYEIDNNLNTYIYKDTDDCFYIREYKKVLLEVDMFYNDLIVKGENLEKVIREYKEYYELV